MAGEKKQQLKIRPVWLVIIALLVVAVLGGSIYALAGNIQAKSKENDASVSLNDVKVDNIGKDVIQDNSDRVQATVEVQLSDCAVTVGTVFKAAAIVTPANTEQALVWSSNNTGIFEVGQDGVVTVKGVGTAVLTATVGNVSDSVVIEGISQVTDGSSNNLPIYNVAQNEVTGSSGNSGNASSGNGSGVSGGSGSGSVSGGSSSGSSSSTGNGSSSSGNNSGGNGSVSGGVSGGSGNTSGNNGSSGSGSGSSGSTGNGSSSSGNNSGGNGSASGGSGNTSGDNGNNGSSGSGSGSGSSPNGSGSGGSSGENTDGKGADSTQIGDYLPDCGFDKVMSNVYVCRDGNTYQGEIITQPNVTIIYIMQRSEEFDAKVKDVLSKLLPKDYGQVWSNYVTAASDRTFTVEERMVRIVLAANGGHSQIVIYN